MRTFAFHAIIFMNRLEAICILNFAKLVGLKQTHTIVQVATKDIIY